MVDARRVRVERRATRIALTAPVGAAGARRSPSRVVNAAIGPEVQEQQGSSQPVTEHVDGRTATPSLARPSRLASRARLEVPHGRRALAMATEMLRYRPAPDRHDDWLQRIEELITADGDLAALSCSLRPQPPLADNEEQDAPPPPPSVSRTLSPGRKRDPAPGFMNLGRDPEMKQAAKWSPGPTPMYGRPRRYKFHVYPDANTVMPVELGNTAATYQRLQRAMLVPRLLGRHEEEEEMLGRSEGPEPREAADP
ncbi:hypothetical protein D1007_09645 [Hordeum vulgare]|nr:hypothetical protein D1007_09645 [Hordeum vulgare]